MRKWLDEYGKVVSGNRLPLFFDMEQSASVLALASWTVIPYVDEDGVEHRDSSGELLHVIATAKNPLHIISLERTSSLPSEYTLEEYPWEQNFSSFATLANWMFDRYHYCPASGSILIPLYRFECSDPQKSDDGGDDPSQIGQRAFVKMLLVHAQQLKTDNHAINRRLE